MTSASFSWPTPRAAYVHVPFCRHRCGYCNFSVIANRHDLVDRFLSAIDQELEALQSPSIDTLFVGGGTPTHFDRKNLQRFLDIVTKRFQLASDYEWTMEANPEDMTSETIRILADAGVNRVSLGIQSFHDQKLQVLERGHTGDQAKAIVENVAKIISNISIDLIFAAPQETVDQWESDLAGAMSLPIEHLSTYALTYEKGTQFWNRRLHGQFIPTTEGAEVAMYQAAQQITSHNNIHQYEISSFAKPGRACRHNITYWKGQGWYAAGPGATRFVGGLRETNHRSTTTYLKRMESGLNPIAESEVITIEEHSRERAAFGVRMIEGIDLDALTVETGVNLRILCADEIQQCLSQGLIEFTSDRMRLTQQGVMFADMVARELLS